LHLTIVCNIACSLRESVLCFSVGSHLTDYWTTWSW